MYMYLLFNADTCRLCWQQALVITKIPMSSKMPQNVKVIDSTPQPVLDLYTYSDYRSISQLWLIIYK